MQQIFNYLDHLTILDYIALEAQGYEVIIADGHVQAVQNKERKN